MPHYRDFQDSTCKHWLGRDRCAIARSSWIICPTRINGTSCCTHRESRVVDAPKKEIMRVIKD